jgi:hypothetical protein
VLEAGPGEDRSLIEKAAQAAGVLGAEADEGIVAELSMATASTSFGRAAAGGVGDGLAAGVAAAVAASSSDVRAVIIP